jgi:salicylate hydroxylase
MPGRRPAFRSPARETRTAGRIIGLRSDHTKVKQSSILIVGAGLGGLVAAACLIRKGFRVRAFEQAPALGEIGAGIRQSADAVRVLCDLDLKGPLDEVGVKPRDYEFRRYDTGELLARIPFAQAHERRTAHPTTGPSAGRGAS